LCIRTALAKKASVESVGPGLEVLALVSSSKSRVQCIKERCLASSPKRPELGELAKLPALTLEEDSVRCKPNAPKLGKNFLP
jgi:hypothetical protein